MFNSSECYFEFLYRVLLSSFALQIENSINHRIGAAVGTGEEIQDLLEQNVGAVGLDRIQEEPFTNNV